ncbi:MAG: ATP-binding protein [Crenarchaeota archaeon]|nr:ATP-binding protein [Thermoproteota archaeon]
MGAGVQLKPYIFELESFRNFRDVTIKLGDKITVISGQNGVGKSNIISLIASGSGQNKKANLGNNFQPEFYDFFNIDQTEKFTAYKLFLTYKDVASNQKALTKRLSFKDDTADGRGIRIIPRTTNRNSEGLTLKDAEHVAKETYNVGGAARVPIPTIYLSLSRLYPLGEKKETVSVRKISKRNSLYLRKADEKFKEWYNCVIPNSIMNNAALSVIDKKTSSRPSLHMDIENTPALSQSVGQDNVGNIISALVDIFMLSQEEDYNGAIICIDEVDVSLHPDTQIRLLDLLNVLSRELQIQFVISTHSLTILKEMLKKEKANKQDYSVVYLKNPSLPIVAEKKNYHMLKADLFGETTFARPKPKVYFEDQEAIELFGLLLEAFETQYEKVKKSPSQAVLRSPDSVRNANDINDEISALGIMVGIEKKLRLIPTQLGCEELVKISSADSYFKRVIILIDGDARYKDVTQRPKICDYLDDEFNNIGKTDRNHTPNICFLPGYFAPESYLYKILHYLTHKELENIIFWRTLNSSEETALYTADKIRDKFSGLGDKFDNDDLKKKFNNELWDFVKKTHMLDYYYSDYKNVKELICFIRDIQRAYNMTLPLTESNRYS